MGVLLDMLLLRSDMRLKSQYVYKDAQGRFARKTNWPPPRPARHLKTGDQLAKDPHWYVPGRGWIKQGKTKQRIGDYVYEPGNPWPRHPQFGYGMSSKVPDDVWQAAHWYRVQRREHYGRTPVMQRHMGAVEEREFRGKRSTRVGAYRITQKGSSTSTKKRKRKR